MIVLFRPTLLFTRFPLPEDPISLEILTKLLKHFFVILLMIISGMIFGRWNKKFAGYLIRSQERPAYLEE
ncbi:MAG: hypothetical protein EA363_04845 [Balneolaceae bacterium]|nr:MAG: hypothetical protein EA363_04845 [Balneolaceae bacterium]